MLGTVTRGKLLFKLQKIVLPVTNDVMDIATKMLRFDRVLVRCQDGTERLRRIRGKMKRRMGTRVGTIVLASPWGFQSHGQGDIIWRYKRNQAERLRGNRYLKS